MNEFPWAQWDTLQRAPSQLTTRSSPGKWRFSVCSDVVGDGKRKQHSKKCKFRSLEEFRTHTGPNIETGNTASDQLTDSAVCHSEVSERWHRCQNCRWRANCLEWAGWVPCRCHRHFLFLSFFLVFVQTDTCQGNGPQNVKQHGSLDDGHVPTGTSKLPEDLGKNRTALDNNWRNPLEISAL